MNGQYLGSKRIRVGRAKDSNLDVPTPALVRIRPPARGVRKRKSVCVCVSLMKSGDGGSGRNLFRGHRIDDDIPLKSRPGGGRERPPQVPIRQSFRFAGTGTTRTSTDTETVLKRQYTNTTTSSASLNFSLSFLPLCVRSQCFPGIFPSFWI